MKTAIALESFEVLFQGTGLLLSFNLRSNEVDQGCKFIQAVKCAFYAKFTAIPE